MRTPAALIAAAAIKDAFVLQLAPDEIRRSRAWTVLRLAYLLLQLIAFSTEVGCVFFATHAIVKLQMSTGISEVGMATSLIALMRSPSFELEYVSVRASFMTGLLAFTTAQALRVRMALIRYKDLSWTAMWFMLSSVAALLAYNNSQSITYGGYVGLLSKWMSMTWHFLMSRMCLTNPTPFVAVLLFVLGCVSALNAVYHSIRKEADVNSITTWSGWLRFITTLPMQLIGLNGVDDEDLI